MITYEDLEERLEKHALDAIAITTKTVKKIPSGASKYGGSPDLPKDIPWPSAEKRPMTFVAQVALKDVARLDKSKLLPKTGTLAFFALVLHHGEPMEDHKSTPFNVARVIHVPPKTKLERKPAPKDLHAELVLPESKMSFKKTRTWPMCEGTLIGSHPKTLVGASPESKKKWGGTVKLTEEEWMLWAENASEPPPLLMLGHPRSPEFPIGTNASERLLLSAHISANLPWVIFGRNGHMFFHAPTESIRKGKWSDVSVKRW